MISIIITGHGSFAEGILSAAKLISGSREGVYCVPFQETDSTDDLHGKLLSTINEAQGDILILTDIAGGSPFNTAVKLRVQLSDRKIEVVSGVNIPLLLSAILERDGQTLDDFIVELIDIAKFGIKKFVIKPSVIAQPVEDGI